MLLSFIDANLCGSAEFVAEIHNPKHNPLYFLFYRWACWKISRHYSLCSLLQRRRGEEKDFDKHKEIEQFLKEREQIDE